jgi:hypothetical protein
MGQGKFVIRYQRRFALWLLVLQLDLFILHYLRDNRILLFLPYRWDIRHICLIRSNLDWKAETTTSFGLVTVLPLFWRIILQVNHVMNITHLVLKRSIWFLDYQLPRRNNHLLLLLRQNLVHIILGVLGMKFKLFLLKLLVLMVILPKHQFQRFIEGYV